MNNSLIFSLAILLAAITVQTSPVDNTVVSVGGGYNASHAVARGIVNRASDYYCHTHCAAMCGYRAGWCCGEDDCHQGSHRCACYNICYCGGTGYEYRCYYCDV